MQNRNDNFTINLKSTLQSKNKQRGGFVVSELPKNTETSIANTKKRMSFINGFVSFFLISSFIFTPIARVYADEIVQEAQETQEVLETTEPSPETTKETTTKSLTDDLDESVVLETTQEQVEPMEAETETEIKTQEVVEEVTDESAVVDEPAQDVDSGSVNDTIAINELEIDNKKIPTTLIATADSELAKEELPIKETTATSTPVMLATASSTQTASDESAPKIATTTNTATTNATTTNATSTKDAVVKDTNSKKQEAHEVTVNKDTASSSEPIVDDVIIKDAKQASTPIDESSKTQRTQNALTNESQNDTHKELIEEQNTQTPTVQTPAVIEQNEPVAQTTISQDTTDIVLETPETPKTIDELATTTPETASSTAQTADEEQAETEPAELVSTYYNDNIGFSFNFNECVIVGDGEYSCKKNTMPEDEQRILNTSKTNKVYVLNDENGDKEIFYNSGNEIRQITNNDYDDDAPFYDEQNGLIVWHALIDNHYQIMLYNSASDETSQITNTKFNNTNPHIFNGTMVWQGWIENNWEIFKRDFTNDNTTDNGNDNSAENKRITFNSHNDMFPKMYEQYISWQAQINGAWKVVVFDIISGKEKTFEDGGGSFESPRFVMLIEKRKPNGDIESVGYDVNTGERISFGFAPKPVTSKNPELPKPLQNQEGALPATTTDSVTKISAKDEEA